MNNTNPKYSEHFKDKNSRSEFFLSDPLKGTVSLISSEPPYKDDNARLTRVPLKPLSDHLCGRYCRFSNLILIISRFFFCTGNALVNLSKKLEIIINL